jgi:hypothetical protein
MYWKKFILFYEHGFEIKSWYAFSVSIQGDSSVGNNFLGLCDQKISFKHVSNFERLQSCNWWKPRMKRKDYLKDMI